MSNKKFQTFFDCGFSKIRAGTINIDNDKDAFCGPGIVEIKDGEVIALYNEIPAGATMVKKDIDAAAFDLWSLLAKAKWD